MNEENTRPRSDNATGATTASGIETLHHTERADNPYDWSYIYVHNTQVEKAQTILRDAFDRYFPGEHFSSFVHKSYRIVHPSGPDSMLVKKFLPTIPGLVFLQGSVDILQQALKKVMPTQHLANDHATGRPARISRHRFDIFKEMSEHDPQNVIIMRDTFEQCMRNHSLVRILTGPFAGCEGIIMRVRKRDRIVMNIAGIAVAMGNVHKEAFEVVPQPPRSSV